MGPVLKFRSERAIHAKLVITKSWRSSFFCEGNSVALLWAWPVEEEKQVEVRVEEAAGVMPNLYLIT